MSGVTPLNIIVRELKTLAQAHDQVKSFAYGHFLDVIKDNVIEYALVHVNIRSANKAENANTFSIELGVIDKGKFFCESTSNRRSWFYRVSCS